MTSKTQQSSRNDSNLAVDRFSFRNRLINGNFDFWVRGSSFSTPSSGAYGADRWLALYDGTIGAFTLGQQALAPADIAGASNFLRWDQTGAGGSSTFRYIGQRIEGVRSLAAETVCVSFWAKADSVRTVVVAATQNFGSGGSTAVRTQLGSVSLTTSWQLFTVRAVVPSIAGKTVGADNYVQIQFELPINVVMTIDLAQAQVEVGQYPTKFESRHLQIESALCKRYYEAGNQNWGGICTANSQAQTQQVRFSVEKRKTPALAFSSASYTSCASSAQTPSATGFFQTVSSSVASGAISYSYNWSADSEL